MTNRKDSILLVDDDPEAVWALGRYFTRAGFPVTTCGDGEEAISLLKSKQFDTVITDIQMPRLNGLALVDWMRTNRTRYQSSRHNRFRRSVHQAFEH